MSDGTLFISIFLFSAGLLILTSIFTCGMPKGNENSGGIRR